MTRQVNAGCYVFRRRVVDTIPGARVVSVERETFPGLVARRRARGRLRRERLLARRGHAGGAGRGLPRPGARRPPPSPAMPPWSRRGGGTRRPGGARGRSARVDGGSRGHARGTGRGRLPWCGQRPDGGCGGRRPAPRRGLGRRSSRAGGDGVALDRVTVGDGAVWARARRPSPARVSTATSCSDRVRASARLSHSAPPSTAMNRSHRPTRPSTKNNATLIRSCPASTARIANGGKPLRRGDQDQRRR